MVNLVDEKSTKTLLEISEALFAKRVILRGDCPWVRVGNLYLSITITGNESWSPVVSYLHEKGHTNFTVLSGRHGAAEGGFALDGQMEAKVASEEHYKEDKEMAKELIAEIGEGKINITVEDVAKAKNTTRDALKTRAKLDLDKGNTVIFAWCNSITSMYLYNEGEDKEKLRQASANAIYKKQVITVVKDKYDWVKRFINLEY